MHEDSALISGSRGALAIAVGLSALAAPEGAFAAAPQGVPSHVVYDASFQSGEPTVVLDDSSSTVLGGCPDKSFAAVVKMSTSVPGCNVIGTTTTTKVTYGWFKHMGNYNPCIWGKSFNSKAQPTWPELGCGTGRTKAVAWGKVAASKQIRGLTAIGWAGVQWS